MLLYSSRIYTIYPAMNASCFLTYLSSNSGRVPGTTSVDCRRRSRPRSRHPVPCTARRPGASHPLDQGRPAAIPHYLHAERFPVRRSDCACFGRRCILCFLVGRRLDASVRRLVDRVFAHTGSKTRRRRQVRVCGLQRSGREGECTGTTQRPRYGGL